MTEPRQQRCDTTVGLKEYIEKQLELFDRAIREAKELMQIRLELASTELERRLHELNQLRGNVMTKSEFESQHAALSSDFRSEAKALHTELELVQRWVSKTEGIADGKASTASMYFAVTSGLAGLVIALAGLIHSLWK